MHLLILIESLTLEGHPNAAAMMCEPSLDNAFDRNGQVYRACSMTCIVWVHFDIICRLAQPRLAERSGSSPTDEALRQVVKQSRLGVLILRRSHLGPCHCVHVREPKAVTYSPMTDLLRASYSVLRCDTASLALKGVRRKEAGGSGAASP